jgi:hypothetical protein
MLQVLAKIWEFQLCHTDALVNCDLFLQHQHEIEKGPSTLDESSNVTHSYESNGICTIANNVRQTLLWFLTIKHLENKSCLTAFHGLVKTKHLYTVVVLELAYEP